MFFVYRPFLGYSEYGIHNDVERKLPLREILARNTVSSPPAITAATITPGFVRSLPFTPRTFDSVFSSVFKVVFFCIIEKFKILNSVVVCNTINVVNNLISFKIPTNVLFHYETVLPHVFRFIRIRMIRNFYIDITLIVSSPPFPIWMSSSTILRKLLPFICRRLSFSGLAHFSKSLVAVYVFEALVPHRLFFKSVFLGRTHFYSSLYRVFFTGHSLVYKEHLRWSMHIYE